MLTKNFNYSLPEKLIAQTPTEKRENSRLMVIHKSTGAISHHHFYDLPLFLSPSDVVVFNDTKVMKSRLFGTKSTGAKIELFLLKQIEKNIWQALIKPAKRLKVGDIVTIAPGFEWVLLEKTDSGNLIQYQGKTPILDQLEKYGNIPLPPYIDASKSKKSNQYSDRYQTVLAQSLGSVAAPTAGLHFTNNIIDAIHQKGVASTSITLHVGYGTFKPISTDVITDHKMHAETYSISEKTALKLNKAITNKSRIIATGTTVTRTLESAYQNNQLQSGTNSTNLFIYPGYSFKTVSGLITNFHLPKSSLLVLVSAFAGKPLIDRAYQEAIEKHYRFYSFGDAMLILD